MIRMLNNCWERRWVRGLVYGLAALITVLVLLSSGFSWWGARAWSRAVARLEVEKETLDFREVAPDPVPDEANFCALPLLKDLCLVEDEDAEKGATGAKRKRLAAAGIPVQPGGEPAKRPGAPNGAALGEPVDLKPWADLLRSDPRRAVPDSGNPAKDLLAMFAKDDGLFAELAAGLGREQAQCTPAWKTRELPDNLFAVQLPHYQPLISLQQALCLRSIAAARAGETAKAHESLRIAIRLAEASLQEPFLIGMLVGTSQLGRVAATVWELCRAQTGTAADFLALQRALERCDVRNSALQAYRAELAAATGALLWLNRARDARALMLTQDGAALPSPLAQAFTRALPAGFFTSNAATIVELQLDHLILPLRDQGLGACAHRAEVIEGKIKDRYRHRMFRPGSFFAFLVMPAVARCTHSACYAQGQLDQSIAACALERRRMEKGAYPRSLGEVSRTDGRDLPRDVFSGKSLGYRRTDDGRYALWCTGPDGKDEGGSRGAEGAKPREAEYRGDWVWSFSPGPG